MSASVEIKDHSKDRIVDRKTFPPTQPLGMQWTHGHLRGSLREEGLEHAFHG